MIFATAALAAALAALPASMPPKLPVVPPVTLTGAWISIPLPAAPLGIAVHDGTIWVCGWNEMIAESSDGGRNWTVRNLKAKDGELLFSFAFFDQGKMAVFGSAGVWYSSADGGATWVQQKYSPGLGLTRVAFADENYGYGINGDEIAWTNNGGHNWQFGQSRTSPVAVAALGPKRAAILAGAGLVFPTKGGHISADTKSQTIFSTANGGKHWAANEFPPSLEWAGLVAGGGVFRLYGAEVQGKKRTPAAALSADGDAWRLDAAPAAFPSHCNAEGCLLDGGAWAAWPGLTAALALPDDPNEPLTLDWAAAGGTVCRISEDLRCRTGSDAWHPGTTTAPAAITILNIDAALCASCPAPKYPMSARQSYLQGVVVLSAEIGTDGHIHALTLLAAPSAALARSSLEAVRGWIYHPLMADGVPQPVRTHITVRFTLGD